METSSAWLPAKSKASFQAQCHSQTDAQQTLVLLLLEWSHSEPVEQTTLSTSKKSHSGRFTHELGVLWVTCWGRRHAVAQHFFSFFAECFSLQCVYIVVHSALTCHFPLSTGFDTGSRFSWPLIHSLQVKSLVAKRTASQLFAPCSHGRVIYRTSRMRSLYCLAACSTALSTFHSLFPQTTNLKSQDILKP